MTTSGYGIEVY